MEVVDGCVRFAPRLMPRSELLEEPARASFRGLDGEEVSMELPAGSLAFTYCQVPVVYRLGDSPALELEYADGRTEQVRGDRLERSHSQVLFGRGGEVMCLTVTVPGDQLYR